MPDHQTIIVTQNNTNDGGCLGGCGTLLAVMIVVGLLVKYWYVAVPVAVLAVGVGVWLWSRQQAPAAPAPAIPAGPGTLTAADCAHCGQPAAGNFCQHCGTARGRTCADCGQHGLNSAYCPWCGSATYAPPRRPADRQRRYRGRQATAATLTAHDASGQMVSGRAWPAPCLVHPAARRRWPRPIVAPFRRQAALKPSCRDVTVVVALAVWAPVLELAAATRERQCADGSRGARCSSVAGAESSSHDALGPANESRSKMMRLRRDDGSVQCMDRSSEGPATAYLCRGARVKAGIRLCCRGFGRPVRVTGPWLQASASGGALSPVGGPWAEREALDRRRAGAMGRLVRAGARAYLGPRPCRAAGRRHDG
jgi:rRNA maturation protein Nop10